MVTICIGLVGFFQIRHQISASRKAVESELSVVAELKNRQISHWFNDRIDDANYFFELWWLSESFEKLQTTADPEAKNQIVSLLTSAQRHFRYGRLLLYDGNGKLLFAVPASKDWVGPTSRQYVERAFQEKRILVADLHLSKMAPGTVDMDIFIPVLSRPMEATGERAALGVLQFEVNPGGYLFPTILQWPTVSSTGETLLVRREGGELVYLNELRHRKDTALKLRFPIKGHLELPAAMAVSGREGVVEGTDYRGVRVLAAIRPVDGTPWFIVSKVDKDEIYASLWHQARVTALLFFVLILVAFLSAGLLWRERDTQWLRREIAERGRQEAEILKLNAGLERRVRERTAQLETANKELEAFTYSVSHDLRAPLRGIDGWSQALAVDYDEVLDAKAKEFLGRVRGETQRMGHLIDDLLKLSRITRCDLRMEMVNLSELAGFILSRLREREPDRKVEIIVLPGLTARCDQNLLEIALTNLLGNAWKFTGGRPTARIEFGRMEDMERRPFFIRDNGAGFDTAYASKLFGAFQRLHKASEFPGTGIGLATAQRVISRHGGKIWAEARMNEGATFFFTLGDYAEPGLRS